MKRTLRFQDKTYHVTRLYSSGVGEQFAVQASMNEPSLLLTDEIVRKNPQHTALMDACRALFGNATIFNGPPNWHEELKANEKTIPGPNPVRK
jgi:hypothetical protein